MKLFLAATILTCIHASSKERLEEEYKGKLLEVLKEASTESELIRKVGHENVTCEIWYANPELCKLELKKVELTSKPVKRIRFKWVRNDANDDGTFAKIRKDLKQILEPKLLKKFPCRAVRQKRAKPYRGAVEPFAFYDDKGKATIVLSPPESDQKILDMLESKIGEQHARGREQKQGDYDKAKEELEKHEEHIYENLSGMWEEIPTEEASSEWTTFRKVEIGLLVFIAVALCGIVFYLCVGPSMDQLVDEEQEDAHKSVQEKQKQKDDIINDLDVEAEV